MGSPGIDHHVMLLTTDVQALNSLHILFPSAKALGWMDMQNINSINSGALILHLWMHIMKYYFTASKYVTLSIALVVYEIS